MSTKKPPANAKRRSLDTDFKRQAVGFVHRLGFRQAASDFAVSKVNLRN